MTFVEYGGIQKYGQLLNGWMQRGVFGTEPEADAPVVRAGRAGPGVRKIIKKSRDDRDLMDILTMIQGIL
jgi:hypothetical protein